MSCDVFARRFTIFHLSIESCILIVTVMLLQVHTIFHREEKSAGMPHDQVSIDAFYSLLRLYSVVMMLRNIVGWIGITTKHVIYLFVHQITTGVILFMNSVLAMYGLVTDHERVLIFIVVCFAVEIPTFVTANTVVLACRATLKGKTDWERMFGEEETAEPVRRATIA